MKALFIALLFVLAAPADAAGNWIDPSKTPSKASDVSLEPLINLTAISAEPANSRLTVQSLHAVGNLIEVVAVSAATGVSVTWNISVEALKLTGLAVGGVVVVTAVSAGFLLMLGSEALAFIPNEISRTHTHHRNLSQ
jgi:hypothetical protein